MPTIRVGSPGYSGQWVAGATTVIVRQRNQYKGDVSARPRLCTGERVVRTRRVRAARGPVVTASSPPHPARIRNARHSAAASRSTPVSKHQGGSTCPAKVLAGAFGPVTRIRQFEEAASHRTIAQGQHVLTLQDENPDFLRVGDGWLKREGLEPFDDVLLPTPTTPTADEAERAAGYAERAANYAERAATFAEQAAGTAERAAGTAAGIADRAVAASPGIAGSPAGLAAERRAAATPPATPTAPLPAVPTATLDGISAQLTKIQEELKTLQRQVSSLNAD